MQRTRLVTWGSTRHGPLAFIDATLRVTAPAIVVGQLAVQREPAIAGMLSKVAKPKPLLRADAVAMKCVGNRVYLAGTNDESHYYAASELLYRWGCRFYMPGEMGEIFKAMALARGFDEPLAGLSVQDLRPPH